MSLPSTFEESRLSGLRLVAKDIYACEASHHSGTSQSVLVKFLRSKQRKLLQDEVLNEIRDFVSKWVAIDHPSIWQCHGLAYDLSDCPAIVMPSAANVRLLCDRNSFCPEQSQPFDKLTILQKLISAIVYLHSKDVEHGAIRPENVFIIDGEPSLVIGNRFEPGCGGLDAARWAAPEVTKAGRMSKQSDVYSFGMVCYYLVSENSPFENKTRQKDICDIVNKNLRPERPLSCSDGLGSLMNWCWQASPDERPTAVQVEESLVDTVT